VTGVEPKTSINKLDAMPQDEKDANNAHENARSLDAGMALKSNQKRP
jgi:hypothetical protein